MFKGYNLRANFNAELKTRYEVKTKKLLAKQNDTFRERLKYLLVDAKEPIDGSKLQEDWFPNVNADVFISHSHRDKNQALVLAGYLKDKFNLTAFIDSTIWGNSVELLKLIDDKYCKSSKDYYSYDKRNYSTAHVHMMLSTALNQMIDKVEVLIFINTPQSITSEKAINKTNSPWIYSELATSKTIRKVVPKRHIERRKKEFTKGKARIDEDALNRLSILYDTDLNHLTNITEKSLDHWSREFFENSKPHPLDILYKLYP